MYNFGMSFSRTLARWFPVPKLLTPPAAGVDITDTSVKWLSFKESATGLRVVSCGTQPLPQGVVERGAIKDPRVLAEVLKEVKKKSGLTAAHAALPEEDAYVFGMHVPPKSSRSQIVNMIEFELEARVPIPPTQAVYDFDTVQTRDDGSEEIAVTVFPRDLAEGYTQAFMLAGIDLISLEIEPRSIGRAISPKDKSETALVVDCGYARTGVAILKRGIPIFTSTIDIGGAHLSKAVMDSLKITEEDARIFKNEHGLVPDDPSRKAVRESLDAVAGSLAEEIGKHYRFWDTRRNEKGERAMPVERVYLLGGSANLKGLPEYIAGKVHAETLRPDVWCNAFSFEEYIPPLDYRASLQYATAIGLALRGT